MARGLRLERAGSWYHVTGRGNERKNIFRDDRDRHKFCELLGEMVERFNLTLHGFVLMDNHYHLVVELHETNLSRAMQWLNAKLWLLVHERVLEILNGKTDANGKPF